MSNYRQRQPYFRRTGHWRSTLQQPTPEPAFGSLMRELSIDCLKNQAKTLEVSSRVSECTTIASYNWLDAQESTIAIPGKPPRWTPLKKARRLPEDSGEYFRDRNAARFPAHPLEPAIIAAISTCPKLLDEHNIDIVTCSSVLGNLLKFILGEDKTFRVLVEVVSDTVFFTRRENSPTELIPGVYGFGHTFPEHYTTWDADARGSTSHQRVLSYQFGQLSFLVRFGADGYIPENVADEQSRRTTSPVWSSSSSSIGNLVISSPYPTASAKLHTVSAGKLVEQGSVFDLKTRSSKKKDEDTIAMNLHRLWTAQIEQFILARHDNGVFNDIQVLNVQSRVKDWEQSHTHDLSLLAALIHQIIAQARDTPGAKLEIRRTGQGTLELREQLPEAGDALSPSVKALWCSRGRNTDNQDSTSDESDNLEWHGNSVEDFTACSVDCGYCGNCSR